MGRARRRNISIGSGGRAGLALAVACVFGAAVLPTAGATTARPAPRAEAPAAEPCATEVADGARRAATLERRHPAAFRRAAHRNDVEPEEFSELAEDDGLWVDRCGKAFYVEESVPAAQQRRVAARTTAQAGTDVSGTGAAFLLESRPGSARTLYLDFDGDSTAGTAWNSYAGGGAIVSPAYDSDGNPGAFSTAELTEIQRAWQVVAEDYAPFDVNVTTKDPGAAALDRTSTSDTVYGARVVVTGSNAVFTGACGGGCGGIAYVDVFNLAGSQHNYYQPGWVFTQGTTTNGKYVGEAASHEAGHLFGLSHDGTATAGYYSGSLPWAPIMGAAYSQPISQWSRGEYPGANQTQDDLAIIATGAPVRADDHGDTAATATALAGTALDGVIATRTDVDTFSFTASGATTVAVSPAAGLPNLDVLLTIRDAAGATVTTANPAAARVSDVVASGLGATATFTAPAGGARYTASVDGVGTGSPATAGLYSDYGSLGNFRIALTTGTVTSSALSASAATLPRATVGTAYSAVVGSASGGTAPYTWSATGALPAGLGLAADGRLSGTPSVSGSFSLAVSVRDAAGATAALTVPLVIDPASTTALTTSNASLSGSVGVAFSQQLRATGGTSTYAWSTTSALPAGLRLSSSGLISGTPTAVGTTSLLVRVASGTASASATVTITIAAAPLAITTTTLPDGRYNSTYGASITSTGGNGRYSWRVSGLPYGMGAATTNGGATLTLNGRPLARGTFSVVVTVTDGAGATATRTLSLRIL
ncbi:putative Ig domain-containing protein [Nocardioides sp.]|uniref:putative Ig domain-containing protein n=1 Tax=Nocardioides sp. TaxID=35761 RepID=UPI00351401D8